MPFTKKELKAVAEHFAASGKPTYDLIVRRKGTAYQRDVLVDGKVRLKWKADGTSYPLPLPSGAYTLYFFIRGKKANDTYSFVMTSPHNEPLGADTVGPLLVEAYDRDVVIP